MNKAYFMMFGILISGFSIFLYQIEPNTSARPSESSADVKSTEGMPDGFRSMPLVGSENDSAQSAVMKTLAAQMSRETDDLEVVNHPDGRRSVHLGGRFMHMSAIVTGANGNPEVQCFTEYQELATSLSETPLPTVSLSIHDH